MAVKLPAPLMRWVYVYEAHVIGIGKQHLEHGEHKGFWQVVVLPDWMSQGFVDRLTPEAMGTSDPIHYVTIVVPEDYLIMGETVQSFEMTKDAPDFISPPERYEMSYTRILLDGVLIWGKEEYPGERQIVIPKVKIPKKLREGGIL